MSKLSRSPRPRQQRRKDHPGAGLAGLNRHGAPRIRPSLRCQHAMGRTPPDAPGNPMHSIKGLSALSGQRGGQVISRASMGEDIYPPCPLPQGQAHHSPSATDGRALTEGHRARPRQGQRTSLTSCPGNALWAIESEMGAYCRFN